MRKRAHPPGISMLEITIVIGLLAALAGFLVTRLGRLQLDAERAAMQQVLQGVRSVLNLQVASCVASGRRSDLRELVGSNPMEQFSTPPANYVGRVRADDAGWVQGGHWYFDEDGGPCLEIHTPAERALARRAEHHGPHPGIGTDRRERLPDLLHCLAVHRVDGRPVEHHGGHVVLDVHSQKLGLHVFLLGASLALSGTQLTPPERALQSSGTPVKPRP